MTLKTLAGRFGEDKAKNSPMKFPMVGNLQSGSHAVRDC